MVDGRVFLLDARRHSLPVAIVFDERRPRAIAIRPVRIVNLGIGPIRIRALVPGDGRVALLTGVEPMIAAHATAADGIIHAAIRGTCIGRPHRTVLACRATRGIEWAAARPYMRSIRRNRTITRGLWEYVALEHRLTLVARLAFVYDAVAATDGLAIHTAVRIRDLRRFGYAKTLQEAEATRALRMIVARLAAAGGTRVRVVAQCLNAYERAIIFGVTAA